MRQRRLLLVAAALALVSLALFWPGYAMYDTVAQYDQVVSGSYADWHPPAMARLWSVLPGRGTASMLLLQLVLYWLGLGLIAAAVGGRSGIAVLATGALPPFLGWQVVVLKDAQLVGALCAATGLIAWWRLRGQAMPRLAAIAATVLIGYAVLVRANAVFAGVPLGVMLVGWPRRPVPRSAAVVALVVAGLAVLSPINHALLGAARSGVERTEALYDLSGIGVRAAPGATDTGLLPAEADELRAKACVRPFFWDPLGEEDRCDATLARLRRLPVSELYLALAKAALLHPVAYATHRLTHLNSTDRWLVALYWPGAAPPQRSEPNALGLTSPSRAAARWQQLAGWLVETPLGWPIGWLALAMALTAIAFRRAATPRRDLAVALLVSALTLEASFAVLSIASDLRYHLWPMIATALATVLLVGEALPSRRAMMAGSVALAAVLVPALVARAVLPIPPQSYTGMLGP